MILIGEKLNSSIPKTLEALNSGDTAYLRRMIKKQAEYGADYIDINTALTGQNEISNMRLLTDMVVKYSKCGVMLDSPDQNVIIECLPALAGRKVIINSITLEDRFDDVIHAAKEAGAGLVALPICSKSIPQTARERFDNACTIIEKLRGESFADKNIYIDVLTEAIATNETAASVTAETCCLIRRVYPDVHIICGLSNVSFGLPCRAELNAAFLITLTAKGLDSAILDVTSERITMALSTCAALRGEDEYCMDYIRYTRSLKES